jgi:hypothetical protein
LKTWEAVVAQHPGRADGWIGLARVRWWTDDLPGARAALAEASTRAPADDEIRTLAERLIEPPVWRLDVGYAWTSSTVTRPLERTAQIHVARRLGPHLALGAGYERWTRALGEDHRGLVDAGGAIGSWGWTLAASLAPGAQAAPRSTQTLGMTTGSWNRLHAAVEAVHARYQRQDSWQVAPGVGVVPVDGWLLEAQARLAWLDGAPAWSRSVRLAWSDQPLQPFLATAWGREPDPERADRRFHAWWGGLTIPYGTFWAVTCTAGLISSPDEPDRRTASSGVIWRF